MLSIAMQAGRPFSPPQAFRNRADGNYPSGLPPNHPRRLATLGFHQRGLPVVLAGQVRMKNNEMRPGDVR